MLFRRKGFPPDASTRFPISRRIIYIFRVFPNFTRFNFLKVINSSTNMWFLHAVLLLVGLHVSYGVPTQTDTEINEETTLEPTADFLALLGKRIELEASVHGDSSQEVEEQLYRIQANLDNTLRGKERDISETLQILAAILKTNNLSVDEADEYGFWRKAKQKLTSPKARKIYKIAARIAIRAIG